METEVDDWYEGMISPSLEAQRENWMERAENLLEECVDIVRASGNKELADNIQKWLDEGYE